MEKDKNDSNVACFDCCYHPEALRQMDINKRFRDSLVVTAMEGVEEAYKRQRQDVSTYSTCFCVVWCGVVYCYAVYCGVCIVVCVLWCVLWCVV